ncbi:Alpha-2-macroglobulin receptor-associated protein [Heterocephalus glaber]|uniref:Alpha-2-macroglobulin receptor-associated protein n=1 Tax=Heterocephalus glaber TaxID=10181 RepID=G5APL5_HETGA|nr:Alpha-2-macroglobulin receptor-associated protein [Heterocephalus glaber]
MEKLNQLWEKARRVSGPGQGGEGAGGILEVTEAPSSRVKMQERDELNWKKLKVEGLDEDGEREALLVRNLNVLLARYGLDGRKDTQVVHSNALADNMQDDKLGHKAKSSWKFSSEELDKLWREFLHHKAKVQEYNVLLDTLSRTEEAYSNDVGPVDLSLGKGDALYGKHRELKEKLQSINRGFDRLHKTANFTKKELESFRGDHVYVLPMPGAAWATAVTGPLGAERKAAERLQRVPVHLALPLHGDSGASNPGRPGCGGHTKEELKHFEAKVEKHNHYQKQQEISHKKLKHMEPIGHQEHVSRNREKYTLLEERTKELGYKVKRHLQDLSSRVSRTGHNEL